MKNKIKQFTDTFPRGSDGNQMPIIGVLTQTLEEGMKNDTKFANYSTYIMTAYVEFLESAGARVVPLVVGESKEVTLDKLSKLNGVLLPGGDGDYMEYGRFIFEKIKEYNDNGTYYPVWGTCMGYEDMAAYVSKQGWNILEHFEYSNGSLALEFTKDPRDTQMYGWL